MSSSQPGRASTSLIYWWICHLHNQGEPPLVSSTGGYVIFTTRENLHQSHLLVDVSSSQPGRTSTSLIYWWMCHLHNQGEPPLVSSTGGCDIFTTRESLHQSHLLVDVTSSQPGRTSTSLIYWWMCHLHNQGEPPLVSSTGGCDIFTTRESLHQSHLLVDMSSSQPGRTSTSLIYWWMCHLHNQGEPPPVSSTGGCVIFTTRESLH